MGSLRPGCYRSDMRNLSKHRIFVFIAPAVASVGVVSASASDQPDIILDGSMDDWPAGLLATADERWIYLRYDASEPLSLQNGSVMTVRPLMVLPVRPSEL